MKIFLIVIAVIAFLIALICSISATFTVIYDKSWKTTIKILWIEKDIELTKILSFILFPKEKAEQAKAEKKSKKASGTAEPVDSKENKSAQKAADSASADSGNAQIASDPASDGSVKPQETAKENESEKKPQKPKKPNYLKSLWDKEGIVGIMSLASNMLQTASSALGTLFKGFHIYSLYVKIIVGGSDAADIAQAYGRICSYYYPVKGIIATGMRVDNYDDYITADYIAPSNEYGFQFIGSISVGLLLKVVFAAAKTFLINFIKK